MQTVLAGDMPRVGGRKPVPTADDLSECDRRVEPSLEAVPFCARADPAGMARGMDVDRNRAADRGRLPATE